MSQGSIGKRGVALLAPLLVLAACARTPTNNNISPPLPTNLPNKIALEEGDVLQIQVFEDEKLSGKFQVTGGTIDYPLIGRVQVAGLTPPAVAELLRKRLADGYLRRPQVSVFVEGYTQKRRIFVWGQVQKAGTFNYINNMSIVEAITLAGGLTPMAEKNVTLVRVENGQTRTFVVRVVDASAASWRLRPGDVVFVPERIF